MEATIHCKYDTLADPRTLRDHHKNRNKHSDEQIERLAKLYGYHGVRHPIIVSSLSGCIVAGHGRKLAAIKAGIPEMPVVFQSFADEQAEYAFIQADNAIALWADLDLAGINADLGDLGPDFDLDMLGIEDFTLDIAEKLEPGCDEDDVPEARPEPKVVRGEVYILGNHRLMCGDSTAITDVQRLMDGRKADFVFSSPPYNGNTSIGFAGSGLKNTTLYRQNETDAKSSEEYLQFNRDIFASIIAIGSEDLTVCYNINYNKNSPSEYIDIVSDAKKVIPLRETVAWEKAMAISLAGHNFTRIFEFVFIFSVNSIRMNKNHNDCIKNLWKISNAKANTDIHKACFPVELPEYGINLMSKPGSNVFEPFGGSGTTLIACEKTARSCFMMELDPIYCGVILDRWQKFTGKKAHREDGVSWDEIKGAE
jgi:DNA modification methylase